jgi:hypothetical protein
MSAAFLLELVAAVAIAINYVHTGNVEIFV